MGPRILVFLLVAVIQVYSIPAVTNNDDLNALNALKDVWKNFPPSWLGTDPCGNRWDGISCTNSRVTSITLASMGLKGTISGDISSLSELQILDLSSNKGLSGTLPSAIGNLRKLKNLMLVGCSFFGPIPDSIGYLPQLSFLSLNSNGFTGPIPPSIGNLSNLYWLDLTDNKLTGTIPVSSGTTPGLDLLVHTKHFHFGSNQLSGTIPEKLFSSQMKLIHVLFDSNNLQGGIPCSLGLVQTLEVVRLDNNSLIGPVPANLNNLKNVSQLILSNNQLTGPPPNLTGMNILNYLDLSNNSFTATDFPPWLSTLQSLTTLVMEGTQLRGQIPTDLFSLHQLQTVKLSNNQLNGTLVIGANVGRQLVLIDLQKNQISDYRNRAGSNQVGVTLVDNPVCQETGVTERYCTASQANTPYSTPRNNCMPAPCSANQISSPNCKCAFPYTGLLMFRAPSFSDLGNQSFTDIAKALMGLFTFYQLPVDSVSLSQPREDLYQFLDLKVFPSDQDGFNRTEISKICFVLNNDSGPFSFHGDLYQNFAGEITSSNKSTSTGVIIGAAVGGSVVLLLLLLAGLYAYRQKKRAERATEKSNPFAHWDLGNKSIGGVPQLKGVRCLSFEELRIYTNNFSEANGIGSGGFGKVYRGVLPDGQIIAIKRVKQGSMQGGLEFKNEIELLSRVHHKNVVSLLGFCFERDEQMLIYEFVPNGSLMDSLSGKTGIRLDWVRRLKIALGSARGLAYLHELANPPIIHRDIKSTNILLDEHLNAKVSDFGLSKPMGDNDKTHVTSQVKGTMGYLDPEYYLTQLLTEKSDVYSFGVLMLELVTGRRAIERGKYIVTEVNMALDRSKQFYNLHELVDPRIGLDTTLKGLDKFVDLALKCVQETGTERPTMGEVVKEIESILQLAGLDLNAESATSSSSYDDASKEGAKHPYMFSKEAFDYSGGFPPSKIEPQ